MTLRMPVAVPPDEDQVRTADNLRASIMRTAEEVERWLLAAETSGH